MAGVAIGVVRRNQDPENLCRVKVSFPWHENATESYWARLVAPMAGADRGLVLIPEVGDEVLVAFERDDLRFPYVLGGLWNRQNPPPYVNSDCLNDRKILQSRKKHYLLFADGANGSVELAHEKGRRVVFDDDGIRLEDEKGNCVQIDSHANAVTIKAVGELKIEASSITMKETN